MIRVLLTSRAHPEVSTIHYVGWPQDQSPPTVVRHAGKTYAIDPGFNALAFDFRPNAARYFECSTLDLP